MVLLLRLAGAPPFIEAKGDPLFEILDAVAANAELYEVERHGLRFRLARETVNGLTGFSTEPVR
jgi:hypothetical protein